MEQINNKHIWQEIIDKFKLFEKKFNDNANNPTLIYMFDDFSKIDIESNFNREQILEIIDKITYLRKLFANKQQELINMGVKAISKSQQITTYVNNDNYKK